MATIDKATVEKVAGLANLSLSDEEKEAVARDLAQILAAFAVLDELDVSGVPISLQPFEERGALREDVPKQSLSQEDALRFTKHKKEGFFVGPRTLG